MIMTYYKAFNRDLTCKGFQYEEGEEYKIDEKPILCDKGFHFCKSLVLTLQYYPAEKITDNKYAEVKVLGDTEFEEPTKHKGVTNHIKIIRVLSDNEVLDLVDERNNSGYSNSGYSNSGDSNSGYRNSGYWNSCNQETGYFNTRPPKTIRVFNKPCKLEDWVQADKPSFIYFNLDPELGYKGSWQKAFEAATERDVEKLKALPNFDADVFEELTGIYLNL